MVLQKKVHKMDSCKTNGIKNDTPVKEIYIPINETVIIDKSMGELIFENIQNHLDKIAQIDPETGTKETYSELFSKSIKVAQNLRARGFKPGDVISLCTYNNLDYSSVLMASFYIGTYTAPMDPTAPLCDFIPMLKLVSPKIIFCDPISEDIMEQALKEAGLDINIIVFKETKRNINFSEFLTDQGPEEDFQLYYPENLHDTCCLHFSSGTTGLPKAVCVTHYGLAFVTNHIKRTFSSEVQSIMSVTTPFWISNMNGLILSIVNGDIRVLPKHFDENTCMKYVQDYKVTVLFITPVNGSKILQDPKYYNYDLSSLKIIATGGSPTFLSQYLSYMETFPNVTIVDGYGMTETGGLVLKMYPKTEEELRRINKIITGVPIPGFKYKLVDPETEKICGPNETGELRVKCKCLFKTYYKNQKSFEDSFDSDGFLKTGDLFYYEDDFKFVYVSRSKDIFKYKGWHISPVIIENQLLKHSNIEEAVVIGIPSVGDGEHATAVVIVKDQQNFDKNEITQFVKDNLPDRYHIPGGVYLIDSMPRTNSGKIQKRKLREFILKQKNIV